MNRTALRSRIRALRDVRIVGALVRVADRVWWYRLIRRSGLVDREFYAAQLALPFVPARAATWHYVARGFRRGLSVNPLFDEIFAGGGLPEVFRVPALYAYLVGERATIGVNPWWDAVGAAEEADGPALEHAWANHSVELVLRAGDGERRMDVTAFRELAIRAAREWSARSGRAGAIEPAAPEETRPYSVTRFVQGRDRRYHRKLEQVTRLVQTGRASAAVAMVSADASQWVSAAVLAAIEPRVAFHLHRAPNTWADVVTAETSTSVTAGVLVVLDARSDYGDSDIESLAREGRDTLAIPAHRAQDGTLVGLGAARVGDGPAYRILSGHPSEDAAIISERMLNAPLATGRAFALPSVALADVGGVRRSGGEELEALSLRLARIGISVRVLLDVCPVLEEPDLPAWTRNRLEGGTAVDADRQRAEEVISAAGFDVRGWRSLGSGEPSPILEWRRPHPGAQRWAIKICAPAGRPGSVWGDTHFARGLANALRRRGHTVVVDAYDARNRDSGYLDDVSVSIRGPYRMDPPRWGVSMEWIISHPDEITRAEAAAHDRVFAAAVGWSRRTGEKWGIRVDPLLEATDTDLFHPRGLDRGTDIVFVGTARGIARPSVVAPLAAGIPVKVYGPDWRPFIPQAAIAATSIPNTDLPARYETASVVLNDQWPAMRREGFIAMRPFDAVAVGGRVVSEDVEGIEEIFQGAVVAYRDVTHLVELLQTDATDLFPSDERIAEIAALIRREHSFDARAATLDEAAADVNPHERRG